MKKLLFSFIATAALFGCNINSNYMNCLYSYMSSKSFDINGFFYKYDFNNDGYIQKSDWVYYDFATKHFYQLMGNPSRSNDVFGWKVLSPSTLTNLDIENPEGIFIRIGYPQDYDTRFSWVFIPWQTNSIFKLDGQAQNGSFLYFDLNCDGNPDPLPNILPHIANQNILLPGTEGTTRIAITFSYIGSSTLQCPMGWNGGWSSSGGFGSSSSWSSSWGGGWSSSSWNGGWSSSGGFGSSSSWSSSWGGGWSSSSIMGGCFDLLSFDKIYINKNLVEHHPLPLEYVNGIEVKDGYILGGYIQKIGQNSHEIFQDAIITAVDKSGHLQWSRILNPVNAADALNYAGLASIDKDRFLIYTNYYRYRTGFSYPYGNIVATMNRYGSPGWANLYFIEDSDFDMTKSGLFLFDCSVVGNHYFCYGEAKMAVSPGRNIRHYTKVLPTPADSSCGCEGSASSHADDEVFQTNLAYLFDLDNQGNIVWSKMYTGENPYQANVLNTEAWSYGSVVSSGNALYAIGTNHNTIEGLSKKGLLLTKMNRKGELLWATTLINHNTDRLLEGLNAVAVDGHIYVTFTQSDGATAKETDILVMDEDGAISAIKQFARHVERETLVQIIYHDERLYVDGGDAIYIINKNLQVLGLIPLNTHFFIAGKGIGSYVVGLDILMDAGSILHRYDINGNSCREENHLRTRQLVDITDQFGKYDAPSVIEFNFGLGHIPYRILNNEDILEGGGCSKDRGTLCIN